MLLIGLLTLHNQALQQQLTLLMAAVPIEPPAAFTLKSEPEFCSESDVLRQRAALLAAEDASIGAAIASVHTWTLLQHEQLKAVHEELPLAGNECVAHQLCPPYPRRACRSPGHHHLAHRRHRRVHCERWRGNGPAGSKRRATEAEQWYDGMHRWPGSCVFIVL